MATIELLAHHRDRRPRPARRPARRTDPTAGWRGLTTVLTPAVRRRRQAVVAWALRHGRPVERDALDAILAAKAGRGGPVDRWLADDVAALLWLDVHDLAEREGLAVPARVAESLWTLLDASADGAWFARGSDPLPELRRPLRELAALDAAGRAPARSRRRHPSTQTSPRGRGRAARRTEAGATNPV